MEVLSIFFVSILFGAGVLLTLTIRRALLLRREYEHYPGEERRRPDHRR